MFSLFRPVCVVAGAAIENASESVCNKIKMLNCRINDYHTINKYTKHRKTKLFVREKETQ